MSKIDREETAPLRALAAALLATALVPASASAQSGPPTSATAPAPPPADVTSTLAPDGGPRGLTRVRGSVRPFVSLQANGGGAIFDLAVDHYLARWPLRLSVELSPLALAVSLPGRADTGNNTGAIGHLRLGAALATKYVEVGAAAGTRLQKNGGSGLSLAGSLRLGTLDGLRLDLGYGYVLARNQHTGLPVIGLANVSASLNVPVARAVSLYLEAGASDDLWMHTSLGLRHRLVGDGGPGTWIVSGSFGLAWVLDRPACQVPGTGWCATSSWAAGPTIGLGLERRF